MSTLAPESESPNSSSGVAHGDGDPVALDHAVLLHQAPRQRGRAPEVLLVGDVLVLVGQEDLVTVEPAHLEERPEVGGRVFPGPDHAALAGDLFHLEELSGTGELGLDLVVGDSHTRYSPRVEGPEM
jgi:hypothetical protein